MDTDKKLTVLRPLIPAIALLVLLVIALTSLVTLSQLGMRMTRQLAPLVDASMEIKANAALYHLWFEEYVQGDTSISEEYVWSYLDESQWYVEAMLHGGTNSEGAYIPLDDPMVTEQLESVLDKISHLRKAGAERLAMPVVGGVGSDLDQAFDKSFHSMVDQADELETFLQRSIDRELSRYQFLSNTLITLFVLLTLLVTAGFIFYEKRRRRDIARQLELVEQAGQAQKMEAIGTLAGGVAHDFNNILAAVTGNIYLAKQNAREMPELVDELSKIEELSFRAASLVKQLLAYARKDMVNIELMALSASLQEMLPLLISALPKEIRLNSEFSDEPLFIKGDNGQLHQVILHLLKNAADALHGVDQPVIRIRLETFIPDATFRNRHSDATAAKYARLSISDNGCGIPEKHMHTLFDPFFTTKPAGKGSGLGLAMVFGAMKMHKGCIEVDSQPNEGTTFHLYLPLEEAAFVSESGDKFPRGHGETILLVEDEKSIRIVGAKLLESLGYRVISASSGEQGLELYAGRSDEISLVLSDIVMPGIGGVEMVRRMRRLKPTAKVLFITGYDQEEELQPMALDQDSVLFKPFRVARLAEAVAKELYQSP